MNYEVVEELNNQQIKELHSLFQLEWWTKGREFISVHKMVKSSDVIIGICDIKTKELIGFARVITDFVFKALILDVIVKESYRGRELGRVIMERILNHSSLNKVEHFELYCRPEMLSFYKKWGFTEELGELHFMRKIRSN